MRALKLTAKVIAWIVLGVVLLALCTVLTVLIVARTNYGHRKILSIALPAVQQQLRGHVKIGRIGGNLAHELVLYDVEIDDVEHQPAIRVRELEVHYDLLSLARHEIDLTSVAARGAWVHARVLRDGKLNLTELKRPAPLNEPEEKKGPPYRIRVGALIADLSARYDQPATQKAPARVWRGEATLAGRARIDGGDVDATVTSLAARTATPLVAEVHLAGAARVRDGAVSADGLHLVARTTGAELRKLDPGVALRGDWAVRVDANGPADKLKIALAVEPPAGKLAVHATVDGKAHAAPAWTATAEARGIDPAAAVTGAPPGDVRLDASARGQGARGTIDLTELVADVLGTHVDARGTLDTAGDANVMANVSARDLSRLRAIGVRGLGGRLDAKARIERSRTHLHVDADVSGEGLTFGGKRVGKLTAHVHDHDFVGEAHVQANAIIAGGVKLDTLTLDATGDPHAVALTLAAKGADTALALDAHGTPTTARHAGGIGGVKLTGADLTVDTLSVSRFGQTWKATGPAEVRIHDGVRVEGLELASGAQKLGLDLAYATRGAIAGTLRGERLDLQQLVRLVAPHKSLPKSSLAIVASVHGTKAAPIADLKLSGWSEPSERLAANRTHYHVDGHYADERVRANFAVEAINQSVKGKLDVPTRLAGNRPLHVDVAAQGVDLQKLRRVMPPRLAMVQGRLDASLEVAGTTARPQLAAEAHLHGIDVAPEAKNSDVKLDVKYDKRRLNARVDVHLMQSLGKDAGAITAQLEVPLAVSLERLPRARRLIDELEHKTPIAAIVTVRGFDVGRFPFTQLGMTRPLAAGTIDGSLKLRGTVHQPILDVDVEGHALTRGKFDRIEAVASLDYADQHGKLALDASLRGQPILRLRGRTTVDARRILEREPWKQAPVEVDAEVPGYDLALLADLVPKLQGRLRASGELRGTFAKPTGKLDATIASLELGDMRYDRFEAHATFDGARATARLDAHEVKGGALALAANLPVAADEPLHAVLRAHDFYVDIDNANLSNPRLLKGKLDAMLDVHGPRATAVAEGYLRFKDGQLAIAGDPRVFKDVQVDLAVDAHALTLKDLEAKIADGSLKANGSIALAGLKPQSLELRAYARKFPIPTGQFGAWLDADVTVTGHKTPEGMSGTVVVDKGTARLPKLAGGKKLQKLGPLEDVKFVDARARRAEARREQALASPPTVELMAHIPGPFHVRSKELFTDLKGDLRIAIVGPVSRIFGHVESEGGWFELLGRRYTIDRARVGFNGQAQPDPELDIRLTRQLSQTEIVIEVHGTAKKPQLVLASDPPIYDESEVIAAILSGDPSTTRVDNRSLDQKVTGAVSSLVVGKIKDQIAPNLPIDVIKVDTGQEGATGLADTRVEIGKYITDTIYVSYVHQFGSTLVGTERRNSNEADVVWRFLKHYELDTAFGDAAVGRVNFYWTIRY